MAAPTNFIVERFVLDTGVNGNMKATMNRYRPSNTTRHEKDAGYILLFAHGTGFHKELWEPTIEHLFEIDKTKRAHNEPTQILEAWAVDCQNHGESAALNDDILLSKPGILNIHDYADAFFKLYKSGLLGDLQKGVQKVVILGHSAGAIGAIFSTTLFGPPSEVPFNMVILIDPPIFSPAMANNMTDMYRFVEKTTPLRRDVWESKEAAHKWLQSRIPYRVWDPRILKLYSEHGLRQLPTPFHPDKKGVVLVCSPADEAAAFAGTPDTLKAVEHMGTICGVVPFHLVFGARNDMFSREVQDSVHDPSAGRIIASVMRVKGAGHLVVQEKPDRLADALHSVLNNTSTLQNPKL